MIGLSKDEMNSLVDNLNANKYEEVYRNLIRQYQPSLNAQSSDSQNAILFANEFSGKYINEVLQPLIIDVIEANNKKIAEQLKNNGK